MSSQTKVFLIETIQNDIPQWRISLSLVFAAVLLCLSGYAPAQERIDCTIAQSAFKTAEVIRGLKRTGPVPCFVKDKPQVERELVATLTEKIPPERLKGEELLYKLLRIIPPTYPYKEKIVQLYLSQLGGYYQPEKNYYVMAAWLPTAMQRTIAVHELTHALQNQHFNLTNLLDAKKESSDSLLSYSALAEGDATAVMSDYQRGLGRAPLLKDSASVEPEIVQTVLWMGLMSGLDDIPGAIKKQLYFPYTSGLRFVHHFLKQGGYEKVNALFKNPPKTTKEILKPELYPYASKDLSQSFKHLDGTVLFQDTLGQFFLSVWLADISKDERTSAELASGWAGDRAVVFRSKDDPSIARLKWLIAWEDPTQTATFMAFVQKAQRDCEITLSCSSC